MSDKRSSPLANPEMLVAVSAVVIGACALLVSFYEVRIMRADQRSSVLPLLELSRSYYRTSRGGQDGEAVMRLTLNAENVGIGPARVVDFHVTVDGEAYQTWGAAFEALLGREEPIDYGQSTIMGRTIPPGRSVDMFSLNDTQLAGEIYASFDRFDFQACFCSVFEECWLTSYREFGAVREVAACRPDWDSFEE